MSEVKSENDADAMREILEMEGTHPDCLSDETLARMVGCCSDETLNRMAGCCSGATLARMVGFRNQFPILPKPYTKILTAIETHGNGFEMGDWHHSCGTTHCEGGWLIALTNAYELEKKYGPETTALMIAKRSRPDAPLPNLYASKEAALAFIRARVKEEEAMA